VRIVRIVSDPKGITDLLGFRENVHFHLVLYTVNEESDDGMICVINDTVFSPYIDSLHIGDGSFRISTAPFIGQIGKQLVDTKKKGKNEKAS
jgi:hypothetical protein